MWIGYVTYDDICTAWSTRVSGPALGGPARATEAVVGLLVLSMILSIASDGLDGPVLH